MTRAIPYLGVRRPQKLCHIDKNLWFNIIWTGSPRASPYNNTGGVTKW